MNTPQKTERIWNRGLVKYEKFVKRITNKPVITPHTSLLEEIAPLSEKNSNFIKLCLIELLKNY